MSLKASIEHLSAQGEVEHDPEARQQLGARRSIEQLKLLGLLLLIAAIIVIPIFLLTI